MLRCKVVAEQIASETWPGQPVIRRLPIWLHLAICRHCRSYKRQLRRIETMARRLHRTDPAEPVRITELISAVRKAAERAQPPSSS